MLDIIHIVVDIDNTLLDGTTTHLKYCNLATGRNITKEQVTQFYIYHYYDWTLEDFNNVYEQYGVQMHEESIPLPHAIETIRMLKQDHRITFMTARPEKYRKVTEEWLEHYEVPYNEIIMTEGKLDAFKSINGDLLIDDSPFYAKQFIEHHLPMIVIHYPYNEAISGDTVYRAHSWKEIHTIINNFPIMHKV